MRISFTEIEIDDLIEALDTHFLQDSDDAIEQYQKIRKKFENARIRSQASKSKIKFIREAKRKKANEERFKIQEDILKLRAERSL